MVAISTLTLRAATAIPDQIYKIADQAIMLEVPVYSQTPTIAETKFTYTVISPTPAFVTLLGTGDDNSKVQIVTYDYAETGFYMVTLQIDEEFSNTTRTSSFNLLVTCVHSILTSSTIGN